MKKNYRLLLFFSILAISILNYVYNSFYSETPKNNFSDQNLSTSKENEIINLSKKLVDNGILDKRFDSLGYFLFQSCINLINYNKNVNVNGYFDPNKVNVYILNFKEEKFLQETFLESNSIFFDKTYHNFYTIPGLAIFIDNRFLSLLLLSANNSRMAFIEGEGLGFEKSHITNVTNAYLRLENIEIYKKDNLWFDYFDNIIVQILGRLESFHLDPNNFKDFGESYYFGYFFNIVMHELAHFDKKPNLETNIINEEIRADSIALLYSKIAINKLKPFMKESSSMLFTISFMNFIELMRDFVIYDFFAGVHEQHPKDIFISIHQKDSLSDDLLNSPFLMADRIEDAYYNLTPLLSLSQIQEKINKIGINNSNYIYQHLLARGSKIRNELQKALGIPSINVVYLGYDKLLDYKGFEKQISTPISFGTYWERDTLTENLNIKTDLILKSIENNFEIQKSYISDCYIASKENIFIEIWGKGEMLSELKIFFNYEKQKDISIFENLDILKIIVPSIFEESDLYNRLLDICTSHRTKSILYYKDKRFKIESINNTKNILITVQGISLNNL